MAETFLVAVGIVSEAGSDRGGTEATRAQRASTAGESLHRTPNKLLGFIGRGVSELGQI